MRLICKSALIAGATAVLLIGGAGAASADSNAYGAAIGSPGVLSGNVVQVPIDVPINVCGNSVNLIGALNPSFGNRCSNESGEDHGGFDQGDHDGWHATGWNHHGWDQQDGNGWNDDSSDCSGS